MKYHEILKALIGIPSLSARLDNPFPLVGDKVTISSTSEWVRQHEYLLDGGAGPERSVLDCVLGKSSETVDMSAAGEFIQSVSVSNDSGNASVRKIAYPMLPATEPYFMVTATEIVRVGERGYLSIYAENGYATSRNNTIVARIYKENEPEPLKTVGFDTTVQDRLSGRHPLYLRCCVRPWNIRCGGGRDRCPDRCDFYQTYQQAHNRYPRACPP